MTLKNVLCIAALSATVALTGIPQSTTALVYAEETQIANLDEILRQMYDLYQSGNFTAMYELDTSEAFCFFQFIPNFILLKKATFIMTILR